VRATAAGLIFGLLANGAEAATRTWTGAASALWSDPGNWGGTAPAARDDLVFPVGALNGTNANDLPADTLFNSITWLSGYPDSANTPYSVTGTAILVGAGGLTIAGDLTLGLPITLAADQTWTTTFGGTWSFVTGAIHLGGRTLTFNTPYGLNLPGRIDGSGALVKDGSQPLYLSGANTYAGPTTVRNGRLFVDHPTALGVADGTPENGTRVLDAGLTGGELALGSVAVGNEAVMIDGQGATHGGALSAGGPASLAGPLSLGNGTFVGVWGGASLTLSGVVSGPGALTPVGTGGVGTITLANGGNTFAGGVNMKALNGVWTTTLVVAADHAIAGAPVIDFGAGNTFVLNGHAQTLAGLAGSGVVDTSAAPGVLTLNGTGDTTYGGSVTGTGAIVHSGAGRQAFTGTSTFSGPLVIDHGVVAVTGGSVPAPVTVNNDGRLSLAANGAVGPVTINDGRLQLTDGGAATGNTGTVTLDATATLDIGGGAPAALGQLRVPAPSSSAARRSRCTFRCSSRPAPERRSRSSTTTAATRWTARSRACRKARPAPSSRRICCSPTRTTSVRPSGSRSSEAMASRCRSMRRFRRRRTSPFA
jgi:autotransporter-associated beta strand protein